MADAVPPWLSVMRSLTGQKEVAGAGNNPVIVGMADEIARHYPEMRAYCDLPAWDSDSTAWCGISAAFCMAEAGVRPPFGKTDTDRWGWARAWADDPQFGTVLSKPRLGCVVVMTRSGGGHVTFYESTNASGTHYNCRGGNQSNAVTVAAFPKSSVIALVWPHEGVPTAPDVPAPSERRELELGDTGDDVKALQSALGLLPPDGEFGGITHTQVKAFQAACGLEADGIVGPNTWKEIDDLVLRVAAGSEGLTPELKNKIEVLAISSPLMTYSWPDRGVAPPGYIPGMCLSFAVAMQWLKANDSAATLMAKAVGGPDTDALKWLEQQFLAIGLRNDTAGIDVLRHLWVLLIGLGMRESSGQYCEGRDLSATNTTADTAEAGLFQTSWNARHASAELPKLMMQYWENPNGFLPTFNDGVEPSANDLACYGAGAGAKYQWLARYAPAFACMTTAVGLRVLRKHWGPVNRREVTLNPDADTLLQGVQRLVAESVKPPPVVEPPPVVAEKLVEIKVLIAVPVGVKVDVDVEQVETTA